MKALVFSVRMTGLSSPVWREVVVPAGFSFAQLGEVLVVACGYTGVECWEFLFDDLKARITNDAELLERSKFLRSEQGQAYLAEVDGEADLSVAVADAAEVPLVPLVENHKVFRFLYDFTDEWTWQVNLEDLIDAYAGPLPMVREGMGTAPFEGVGGLDGHYAVMAAITDPAHADYDAVRNWLAERGLCLYDMAACNERLAMQFVEKNESRG